MITLTRRQAAIGIAAMGLASCDNSVGSDNWAKIDRQVASTLDYMFRTYPETRDLADKSIGLLVMPLISEAGFMVGGSYGEGALLIDGVTVDYYSATQATVGFQLGAQQFAYVLFFLTPDALRRFRTSPGWAAGAASEFVAGQTAGALRADTATQTSVIAFLFAQQGLLLGATIEGTKYTRILR